jgi:hypothetical protein
MHSRDRRRLVAWVRQANELNHIPLNGNERTGHVTKLPAMLVHESPILQVTLFGTLQSNLGYLDFSLLLPDVMTIADEVDAQLAESMESYMKVMRKAAAA